MKSIEIWLSEYGQSHTHPTNKFIHWVAVPVIYLTVIGFMWDIPRPEVFVGPWLNWATLIAVPILIFYFVLPVLFSYTVALSPIPLNVIPGDFFELTCTAKSVAEVDGVCEQENAIFLWAWYFLSSIAFSGIIMKLTKTSMGMG